jgi:2-polyprenyl-6-methoxyphenol hydroxylase-like FAD-dependent oxidoreductase
VSEQPSTTPVLVVGAGTVGAVVALELARYGVPSMVVERSPEPSTQADIDVVDGRSLELLHRLGLTGPPGAPDDSRADISGTRLETEVHWTRDLDEAPVLVWRQVSADGPRRPGLGLARQARQAARDHPLIDLREGWTLSDACLGDADVRATVVDARQGVRQSVQARYLAACDGVDSTARRCLGITMNEWGEPTQHACVRFRSGDPRLRQHEHAYLTISARGVTLVCRDGVWIGSVKMPVDEPFTTDAVALVQERLGHDVAFDEVLGVDQWEGSLAVATTYRNGPAFLAGDAAHRCYPVGGSGTNTGIGDAVDLGWKLAAAVQGWGGPQLLNSYERERRPIALSDRELCADLLDVTSRFNRLTRAGASREQLAGVLTQQARQLDHIGVHFGQRYPGSPVICHEVADAQPSKWHRITATTWPGGRPPAVRLTTGTDLFDHFGTGFTLVDLSGRDTGAPLVLRARQRNVPMTHLAVDDEVVRSCWEGLLVLVRPDQHVAWRGDYGPADWDQVLDHVTGFRAL